MTVEIGFLFALLGVMVYFFLTEKLPVDLTAFLGLLVLIFVFAALEPNFLHPLNLLNTLRQVSFTGLIAVGMTFVILTAGIDLSVGSLLALAAVSVAVAGCRVRCVSRVDMVKQLPLSVDHLQRGHTPTEVQPTRTEVHNFCHPLYTSSNPRCV